MTFGLSFFQFPCLLFALLFAYAVFYYQPSTSSIAEYNSHADVNWDLAMTIPDNPRNSSAASASLSNSNQHPHHSSFPTLAVPTSASARTPNTHMPTQHVHHQLYSRMPGPAQPSNHHPQQNAHYSQVSTARSSAGPPQVGRQHSPQPSQFQTYTQQSNIPTASACMQTPQTPMTTSGITASHIPIGTSSMHTAHPIPTAAVPTSQYVPTIPTLQHAAMSANVRVPQHSMVTPNMSNSQHSMMTPTGPTLITTSTGQSPQHMVVNSGAPMRQLSTPPQMQTTHHQLPATSIPISQQLMETTTSVNPQHPIASSCMVTAPYSIHNAPPPPQRHAMVSSGMTATHHIPQPPHLQLSFPQSSAMTIPHPRRLAPRQNQGEVQAQRHDRHQTQFLAHLRQNRSPSPSTEAAAMSLGTLAAAAARMANSTPTPAQTNQASPRTLQGNGFPLAHASHQNMPGYTPPGNHRDQGNVASNHPNPEGIMQNVKQPPRNYPVGSDMHGQMYKMVKPSAKPVAPAPNSAMHPSQQIPNPHPNGKPKQRRYRASPEQLRQLIARFDVNPSPSSTDLQELASKISMPTQSVVLWFKNRRARVPHKKAEKALNAKRRENGELPPTGKGSRGGTKKKDAAQGPKKETKGSSATKREASFSEEAAAASMAELAMSLSGPSTKNRLISKNTSNKVKGSSSKGVKGHSPQTRNAATKSVSAKGTSGKKSPSEVVPSEIAAGETPRLVTPTDSSSSLSPSNTHRPKSDTILPYDTNLVKRLGNNAPNVGAEFVQPAQSSKRPRTAAPSTPRVSGQKEYTAGELIEVLENKMGVCRVWASAVIVGRAGPNDLSLGESAAAKERSNVSTADTKKAGDHPQNDDADDADGAFSPRTVRSPAASPTPPVAKLTYIVEYSHRMEENKNRKLRCEVAASRIRPAAPFTTDENKQSWRPVIGDAVEVLKDGCWFAAVEQKFLWRKGHLVSFESGDTEWVKNLDRMRPHQVWKGDERWTTKRKAPYPVFRKSVGLNVTHPPGGKRKRKSDGSNERETRGRSKRSRNTVLDGSGPNGLPEGWRISELTTGGVTKMVYVAPDGNRLKSLKEAQRYVKLMGPV